LDTTDPHSKGQSSIWDDLGSLLRRRKATVALTLCATVVGVYATLDLLGERYEAEARLLVVLGRENVEVPRTVEKGSVYVTGVQKEEINSYIQLVASAELMEQVLDEIGIEAFRARPKEPETFLQKIKHHVKGAARFVRTQIREVLILLDIKKRLSERQQIMKGLLGGLNVTRERDANVIRVSLRLPDPELARRTVETLLDLYLQRHIQLRSETSIREALDKQTAELLANLNDLQEQTVKIKSKWNLSSVSKQREHLLDRLHGIRRQIDEQHAHRAALRVRRAALAERIETLPSVQMSGEVVNPNPRVESIKERLMSLQLERVRAVNKYKEDSEMVRLIDNEIESLNRLLSGEPQSQTGAITYNPHPVREQFERESERIEIELASVDETISTQRGQADAIELQLQRLDQGENELQATDLERDVVKQKYLTYAERREEIRIAEQLDHFRVANVKVLGAATVGAEPVYPRKLLIMVVGLVAGAMSGVGLALFQQIPHREAQRLTRCRYSRGTEGAGVIRLVRA
jgi:uncharacterized protein involved in exopolysaccharide biosynthesis